MRTWWATQCLLALDACHILEVSALRLVSDSKAAHSSGKPPAGSTPLGHQPLLWRRLVQALGDRGAEFVDDAFGAGTPHEAQPGIAVEASQVVMWPAMASVIAVAPPSYGT